MTADEHRRRERIAAGRHDHREDDDPQDHEAALGRDTAVGEDPDPGQRDQHDRELHHQAEGQHHGRHEADVLVDRQQRFRRGSAKLRRKRERERDDEVADGHPDREERERGEEQRPHEPALASGEAGGHEAPDLEEDHRHGQRDAHEDRDLDA